MHDIYNIFALICLVVVMWSSGSHRGTMCTIQYSSKILTIQQGQPLGVSSTVNPWQASTGFNSGEFDCRDISSTCRYLSHQTPRVKPYWCLPRIYNGTNSPRLALLYPWGWPCCIVRISAECMVQKEGLFIWRWGCMVSLFFSFKCLHKS